MGTPVVGAPPQAPISRFPARYLWTGDPAGGYCSMQPVQNSGPCAVWEPDPSGAVPQLALGKGVPAGRNRSQPGPLDKRLYKVLHPGSHRLLLVAEA